MTRMNTLGSMGLSDYQSRTVTIDVTGVCQQSVLKTGNYQIRVPYSQMSQTMQRINRQGGKVVSIQLMGNAPAVASESAESAEADRAGASSDNDGVKKSSKRKRR
ncbi:MAG: phycobilisome linker polypeptide [Cyanobacteria bacterium P01_A01_bin.116]